MDRFVLLLFAIQYTCDSFECAIYFIRVSKMDMSRIIDFSLLCCKFILCNCIVESASLKNAHASSNEFYFFVGKSETLPVMCLNLAIDAKKNDVRELVVFGAFGEQICKR